MEKKSQTLAKVQKAITLLEHDFDFLLKRPALPKSKDSTGWLYYISVRRATLIHNTQRSVPTTLKFRLCEAWLCRAGVSQILLNAELLRKQISSQCFQNSFHILKLSVWGRGLLFFGFGLVFFNTENFLKELALGESVTWADWQALPEGSIMHHSIYSQILLKT